MKKVAFGLLATVLFVQACQNNKSETSESIDKTYFSVSQGAFGSLATGEKLKLYTLKSPTGMEVSVTNYGAIISSWLAPNAAGVYEDVVLGFDSVDAYLTSGSYFGAVVGRYGNRIAKGKFSIGEETYELATNNDPNHLHGGVVGFDKVVWGAKEFVTDSTAGIVLTYLSKDMEEGYPGNLKAQVTYTLDANDAVRIDYLATTDKSTVVNLTQHSYFNLSGDMSRDILGHELMIPAKTFTPIDNTSIPTGELMPVDGTPFDFTQSVAIGAKINEEVEQIKNGSGYDHNWVLDAEAFNEEGMAIAAVLTDSISGRKMEVITSEPGIQFYSGNFLDGSSTGKGGSVYNHRYGLCLETQHYPDSPNQPNFPTTVLNPGEEYKTTTIYKFSTF